MPTLLADENIPVPAIEWLRARGVEVHAVRELMPGARDVTVLAYASRHRHWLVTFDRDYGELLFSRNEAPPPAVVYLRQQPFPPVRAAELLLPLLDHAGEIEGHFVTITEQATRLRRLPAVG